MKRFAIILLLCFMKTWVPLDTAIKNKPVEILNYVEASYLTTSHHSTAGK
jgi:hypothetical protein